MGNRITNKHGNGRDFHVSNGLTSVFIETLCLAGADIANENYQKDIMIWLAQRDWIILGAGFEGFDIAEINWSKELFEQQKEFILKVIDLALKKKNWELLDYTPHEMVFTTLSEFRDMVLSFQKENIALDEQIGVFDFDGDIDRYEKCIKHKVYKHFQGCVVCNNEPIEIAK